MKIAAIFGSPRLKGNSATLAEAFLQEAERLGAEVDRFHLQTMKYGGCLGCNACKTKTDRCVLQDDLSLALEAVRATETILIATPVYALDVPAQLKALMDRWYSFFKPYYYRGKDVSRLIPGKKIIFVITQRGPELNFMDVVPRYDFIFRLFGFQPMYLIRGCKLGDDPKAAAKRTDLLELARETARRVMAGEPSVSDIPSYQVRGF
jgi:multimeric flavodoxin WrbA